MKKLLLTVVVIFLFTTCKKSKPSSELAIVTTTPVTVITTRTATTGGNITGDINTLSERGICYSTTPNPTTATKMKIDPTSPGNFSATMIGLGEGILYYVRAYAINASGTAYGNEVSFTTLTPTGCTQNWMSQNLDVSTYRNGNPIPQVTDSAQWVNLTTGAWCYYNNDPSVGAVYGKLYNWYAVNDPRGLAPTGWHIPTNVELNTLMTCLGGNAFGGALKETGFVHWISPNNDATNSSGFTALPGGYRSAYNAKFDQLGKTGNWWTATGSNGNAFTYYLFNNQGGIGNFTSNIIEGLSVRCIKD